MAPGVLIAAARAGTSSGYVLMSGTSMAAPFVAGAVALMKEVNPSLTPTQVKSLIHTWSQDWGVAGIDNEYGAGLIDVYALVGAAAGVTPVATIFPVHQFVAASVPDDGLWTFDFEIGADALDVPIAATIIIEGQRVCSGWWRCTSYWSPDLDAELYDPTGQRLDLSECLGGSECGGIGHQETLHAMPTIAGTYTLRVFPYSGSPNNGDGGNFGVDLSAGPLLLDLGPVDEAPTASIMAPATGDTVTGSLMIEVEANDTEDDPGKLNVEIKIGAGGWQSASWNAGASLYEREWITPADDNGATYTITARATDSNSSTTNAAGVNVTVDNVDDPPSALITSPANDANVSGEVLIQVLAEDVEDTALALNVEIKIGAGGWQSASWNAGASLYERTWITPGSDDGVKYKIWARATDTGTHVTNAAPVDVTVDNVDATPLVSISDPGGSLLGTVILQVEASDAEDAAGELDVDISIDGGGWQSAGWNGVTGQYEFDWDTTGAANGSHTIDARATDSFPNTGNATPRGVTVDNPVAATVHAGDLDGSSTNSGWRWFATVTILVHDATHAPVAGANVSGSWSRGSASGTCTTGAGGTCTVTSSNNSRWRRTVTYTVNDIVGSTYAPADNHNGTSITLSRP